MLGCSQTHFSGLRNRSFSSNILRSLWVACWWAFLFLDAISMLCMYQEPLIPSSAHLSAQGCSKWSIIAWYAARELVRPKNITFGSYNPYLVLNGPLCWSPSLICTLLYPQWMSNFEKMFAFFTCVISSGIKGNGVFVLNGVLIELLVVLNWAKFAILLFDEK